MSEKVKPDGWVYHRDIRTQLKMGTEAARIGVIADKESEQSALLMEGLKFKFPTADSILAELEK